MDRSQILTCFFFICIAAASVCGCRGTGESAPVNVIVFDVGGVLSKDMIDTKLKDLASLYDLDADALLSAKGEFRDPADLGRISDSEFWIRILNRFGVQATEKDTEIDSYIELVDGTLDIARSLSRDYRTAILSNDSKEMSALRREKFDFDRFFDPIIISGNVGVKKPDARIYDILLEELGVPGTECLFIDNNMDNVEAARSAGIRAIRFENAEQLSGELLKHGIEIGN